MLIMNMRKTPHHKKSCGVVGVGEGKMKRHYATKEPNEAGPPQAPSHQLATCKGPYSPLGGPLSNVENRVTTRQGLCLFNFEQVVEIKALGRKT